MSMSREVRIDLETGTSKLAGGTTRYFPSDHVPLLAEYHFKR